MKLKLFFALVGVGLLMGASVAAETGGESQGQSLTRGEAISCIASAANVQGQDEMIDRWQRALNSTPTSSNSAIDAWNNINDRLNSAISSYNADDRRFASTCGGVTLSRSIYNEVCASLSGNRFCDSFSFN